MNQNNDIWPIIVRYLDNSLSNNDSKILELWLAENSENSRILHSVSQIWKASDDKSHDLILNELKLEDDWNKIAFHISKTNTEQANKDRVLRFRKLRKRRQIFTNFLKVAVLVVVALASAYLTFKYATSPVAEPPELVLNEIITGNGERARVELSDGTHVTLNSASKLVVPRAFGRYNRSVELDGQAFFDVASDRNRPFYISADAGTVEVIGTAFDVRAYTGEGVLDVVVKEGTVEVNGANRPENKLIVNQGYRGMVTMETNRLSLEWVEDLDRYFGWMEGRLIFREELLSNVFKKIERWYDVEIKVEKGSEDVLQKQFSADLKTRSVQHVMEVIRIALNIEYTIDEDLILIALAD